MAKHSFTCRKCGVVLVVPDAAIGKLAACSSCGTQIKVPTPAEEVAYHEELQRREQAKAEDEKIRREELQRQEQAEAEARRSQEEAQRERQWEEEVRSQAEAEKAARREEAEQHQRMAASQQSPANPMEAVSSLIVGLGLRSINAVKFLNIMGVVMIVAGVIALIAGVVIGMSPDEKSIVPVAIGGVILVQTLWMASLTFVFTSMGRNLFGIHKKLEVMSAAGPEKVEEGKK